MNYIKHFKTTFLLVLFVTLSTNAQVGIGTTTPAYDLDVAGDINLNKGIGTGIAMRVNGAEALWYNGNFFSWGYGANFNYFADRIGIGTETPNALYSLDATGALNVNQGNNNGVGLYINNGKTIAKNGGLFTWGEDGTANYFPRNIGVLTNAPSTTLDVNGGARVRNLGQGYVASDGQGNLSTDINTRSTTSFPNNIWNGVLVYFKSAVLTFAGTTSNGGDIGFMVHYDVGNKSFTPMTQAKCTLTDLGASAGNDGRLQVTTTAGGTHILTFNITGTTANITASGAYWLQGSFFSVVNNR